MSQENVDRMRRTNDAFNRRDLEAWLLNADPDIRISSSFIGQEFQGLDGAREWWREVTEAMPDFKVELDEIQDAGDFVLMRASIRGHGTDSSAPFEQIAWVVTEWQAGKCVTSLHFLSETEALEAAGLRE